MKFKFNSKYTTIAAYTLIVFSICLLLVSIVFYYEKYTHYIELILKVLAPVIWGLIIAYLLNPVMKFTEKSLIKLINKKKEHKTLTRILSITVTMLLTVSLISILIATAVPEVLKSIQKIFINFSSYMNNLQKFTDDFLSHNPKISNLLDKEFETLKSYLMNMVSRLQPEFETLLKGLSNGAFSFLIGIKDFLLGMIVSIYLLFNKETMIGQVKKFMYAMFSQKKCEGLFLISNRVNKVFINFIAGKALDSFIIGLICFVAMTLMDMPYIVLISFIVGITNMVPFFGPFIGAIPSSLLILVEDPKQALIFAIFILILQQFDGNILGPKILGDSLGLPTFWILFAIFLGGGLFGLLGMIVFVPLFSVFYTIIKEVVSEKLKKKNLPVDTKNYIENTIINHDQNYEK